MEILVTLDEHYLPQLQVLLTSLSLNSPGEAVRLWLMHRGMPEAALEAVRRRCAQCGWQFEPVEVDGGIFAHAPVTRQYPQEMYYRLLAPHLLPETLGRVLYLDPDILVINSLRPLWETDLEGNLFAAASHTGKTELMNNINHARLGTDHDYFNSGVLLIDLDAGRREIDPEVIFRYTAAHAYELLLPDQDLLNVLYGTRTLPLDDFRWNYDARNYNSYLLRSSGVCDLDWVMEHTAILHFCGKAKPWKKGYHHRFGVLYKHYQNLTRRAGFLGGD